MPKLVDHSELLKFAANRLYWYGNVSPKDVREEFDIGNDLASRLIGDMRKRIDLVASGKRYVLGPRADLDVLVELGVDAGEFLGNLLSGVLDEKLASNVASVPAWSMESYRNTVKPEVLRAIVHAIHAKRALQITYVGMALGEKALKRTVEPVRLVHVRGRWHLDAFCYFKQEHRDFVLSRILSTWSDERAVLGLVAKELSGRHEPKLEVAWFKPHPDLTDDQQQAVAFEFNMSSDLLLKLSDRPERIFYFRDQFVAREGELPPKKLLVEVQPSA